MNIVELSSFKVSVIVPCYNVAQYIDRCMECLGRQTMRDFELICIDDGSTENTLLLLSTYKFKRGGNNSTYREPRSVSSS